jgi:hypothetical protein
MRSVVNRPYYPEALARVRDCPLPDLIGPLSCFCFFDCLANSLGLMHHSWWFRPPPAEYSAASPKPCRRKSNDRLDSHGRQHRRSRQS